MLTYRIYIYRVKQKSSNSIVEVISTSNEAGIKVILDEFPLIGRSDIEYIRTDLISDMILDISKEH